jgi:hypothetical protein
MLSRQWLMTKIKLAFPHHYSLGHLFFLPQCHADKKRHFHPSKEKPISVYGQYYAVCTLHDFVSSLDLARTTLMMKQSNACPVSNNSYQEKKKTDSEPIHTNT